MSRALAPFASRESTIIALHHYALCLLNLHRTDQAELASAPIDVFEHGFWEWWPDVADGTYLLELRGMGAKTLTATVNVQAGTETTASFPGGVIFGDLSGDDMINITDLGMILANFGL
jgi:hypothetical protein